MSDSEELLRRAKWWHRQTKISAAIFVINCIPLLYIIFTSNHDGKYEPAHEGPMFWARAVTTLLFALAFLWGLFAEALSSSYLNKSRRPAQA